MAGLFVGTGFVGESHVGDGSADASLGLHDAPRADAVTGSARVAMRTALLASALALQANAASLKAATAEQLPAQPTTSAGSQGGVRALRMAGPPQRPAFRAAEELPVAPPAIVHEVAPLPSPPRPQALAMPRLRVQEELPIAAVVVLEEGVRIVLPLPPRGLGRPPLVVGEELPDAAAPAPPSTGSQGGVRALRMEGPPRRPPVRVAEELPVAAAPAVLFESGPPTRRPGVAPDVTIILAVGMGEELALPLIHETAPVARPLPQRVPRRPALVVREELPLAAATPVLDESAGVPVRPRGPAPQSVVWRPAQRVEELPFAPPPIEDVARPQRPLTRLAARLAPVVRTEEMPGVVVFALEEQVSLPRPVPTERWARRLRAPGTEWPGVATVILRVRGLDASGPLIRVRDASAPAVPVQDASRPLILPAPFDP